MRFDIFCNFYTLWLDYNAGLTITENVALAFESPVQTTDGYS